MSLRVRLTGVLAAVLICAVAAPALAQDPFASPVLRDKPKGGFATPTPTPSPTATATATPTASPQPTATPHPRKHGQLADTGADPLRLALAGLALLGFGFSLRLRIVLADADDVRRRD
jgi:hypothetical protein